MHNRPELDASRRLQGFAKKVASELEASGRETLQESDSIPVAGWRVYQCDMYSILRSRRGSSDSHAQWDSVWLTPRGGLIWATIEMRQGISGSMRNTSSWQHWQHNAMPMTIDAALSLNHFPPWREKSYKSGPDQVHECHRLPHRAHPKAAPCQGLSKMLADLRAGREAQNWVLDWG